MAFQGIGRAPLIEAVAFSSFITSDSIKFKQAITFYESLGFVETRSFTQNGPSVTGNLSSDSGFAIDSIREVWLEAFPLGEIDKDGIRKPIQQSNVKQSEGATIKLRLVPSNNSLFLNDDDELKENGNEKNQLNSPAVVFFSAFVSTIKEKLKENNYQIIENENEKDVIFTIDPLSNVIGFSSKPNPTSDPINDPSIFLNSNKSDTNLKLNEINNKNNKNIDQNYRKKIGVMTSGGDSPGMNAAVRAVVRAGIFKGCDVFAIYEGYEGLVKGGSYIKQMQWEDVRGWLSLGGTLIGTARCMEFRERAGRLLGAYNMIINGIDALVVCGGDGSLTGADLFRSEWPSLIKELVETNKLTTEQVEDKEHLTIVGLVGSIDNDMASTDATIGAYSSLERICEMVDYIDATAQSHSRAFVVEVMGRHCGWLGLMAGIASGADYIFIPERPPKVNEWENELTTVCKRHRGKGKRTTIVIVAEGAIDSELNHISPNDVKDVLVKLGLDTRITTLGHVQRGGSAVAYDRLLATLQGVDAIDAVLESTPETPSPMIGINENRVCRKPLMKAVELTKSVATAINNKDFDKAMSLRDNEFAESYQNLQSITYHDDGSMIVPPQDRLNIAIVHIGAPAGGMNAATRAATLYSLSHGHRVFAIQNGFSGLVRHDSIKELNWIDVEGWQLKGGSEIGTNRNLPSIDLGSVAFYFQKYQFDGLIIIGGFEAFHSLYILASAREKYPVFRIPMVCLPATISNNVPGTEYSLGSDTCLNQLSNYCDAIKQSASATRKRVFVVEVQGGHSGYVASAAGLITGALAVYTPESQINIKSMQEDIELLKDNFKKDHGENRAGKILIRNETASSVFTTSLIADIIMEAGKGKFESRTAIPGHVQQGNIPSSMDRVRATRLAVKCCSFIEDWNSKVDPSLKHDLRVRYVNGKRQPIIDEQGSAAVIGIEGHKVIYSDIIKVFEKETNVELRKGYKIHWEHIASISDTLSGRLKLRQEHEDTLLY